MSWLEQLVEAIEYLASTRERKRTRESAALKAKLNVILEAPFYKDCRYRIVKFEGDNYGIRDRKSVYDEAYVDLSCNNLATFKKESAFFGNCVGSIDTVINHFNRINPREL